MVLIRILVSLLMICGVLLLLVVSSRLFGYLSVICMWVLSGSVVSFLVSVMLIVMLRLLSVLMVCGMM